MTHRTHTPDELLDRLIDDMNADELHPAAEQAAIERAWASIVRHTDVRPGDHQLRSCGDFQALIPVLLEGRLPAARALLVEDHTRECVTCRRELLAAKRGTTSTLRNTRRAAARRPIPLPFRLAAAAALLLGIGLLSFRTVADMVANHRVHATVADGGGFVQLVEDERSLDLEEGATVRAQQLVRTTKDSPALLELADGSTVEMAERSELALRGSRRGTTIELSRGNIIVHAAPQGSGRLFVSTTDCGVSVKGTIFAVNHGLTGSRVSVVEGEVEVRQGGLSTVLHPGDQVTTNQRLGQVPVEQEIAWSRNAEEHVALLRELTALRHELDQALNVGEARTSTRLLELAPADTVIFAAIPNLTEGFTAAYEVLRSRLDSSPTLRSWWEQNVVAAGIDQTIEELVARLRPIGEAIGDEVAITVPAGALTQSEGPVVLATLRDPAGFVALLEAELERASREGQSPDVVLVDDLSELESVAAACLMWVRDDLLVVASQPHQLLQVAAALDGSADASFADSTLGGELRLAYDRGVEWLVGVDLHAMLELGTQAARDSEARQMLERLGLLDATTLIVERHSDGSWISTSGSLAFAGPRRGVAAWLAAPAPMGSLEFISPQATVVTSVVAKDAADLFDETLSLIASVNPAIVDEITRFEAEHGIDVRADFAAPLGGEVTIAVDGPVLPTPSWKLVVEVYDPASLQHTIEQMVAEANRLLAESGPDAGQLILEETAAGGTTYHSVRHSATGITVHYMMVDGFMVAAPRRALLEQALQFRATGTTLPASQTFRSLLPRSPFADCSALVYRNLGPLGDALAGAAGLAGMDPVTLQQMTDLSKPSLFCVYGESDRITLAGSGGSLLSALPMLGMHGLLQQHGGAAAPAQLFTDELSSQG